MNEGPDKRLIVGCGTMIGIMCLALMTAACNKTATGKADLFYGGSGSTTVDLPPAQAVKADPHPKPLAAIQSVAVDDDADIAVYSFVDPKNGCRYLISSQRRGMAMSQDTHTACVKS